MAKRKKTKRRAPKKKTQRSEEPDEDDDEAVDASFDEDDDEEVAASSDLDEPAAKGVSKDKAPRGAGDRPVGPALDPGSPNARVSTGGGLWVMAVVFGLIVVAVVAQYFIG